MSEARKALWDDSNHIYNSEEYRKKLSDVKTKHGQFKDPKYKWENEEEDGVYGAEDTDN